MKTQVFFATTTCPNTLAGHLRTACAARLLPLLLLLALPAVVQAQFTYTTNNGTITITGYTGPSGTVVIPDTINNLPVTSIGDNAFYDIYNQSKINLTGISFGTNLTSIGSYAFYNANFASLVIPDSVTNIGNSALYHCTKVPA